jgi:alpha-amylase/alpha-mannosidase (GH57 family)
MNLWHLTPDTPRWPHRVSPNEQVQLTFGTWPVAAGQAVWLDYEVERAGQLERGQVQARWRENRGPNSYWQAELGPFSKGDQVRYQVFGTSEDRSLTPLPYSFRVGPKLYLALLWHQHQPYYRDAGHPDPRGSYTQPWVRLHALRDYYAMADLVAQHPKVHLTINLTPVLLEQLEDYLRGATDLALELTLTPAERLAAAQRASLLAHFFDADWHHQIYPYPRYKALLEQKLAGQSFSVQDIRDLQMWFNLAWFGQEFRDTEVTLVTGEKVSVSGFVAQGQGFTQQDLEGMVAEQFKILRAVIPLHRQLQERGQIEVSTTPYYHPIVPLLVDTNRATLDRPGAVHPRRFAYPQDAAAQTEKAVRAYQRHFGQPPTGMWPAEGAVAQFVLPLFAEQGLRWLATDQGVLARSGRYGYRTEDPDVLAQPYRAGEGDQALSLFFRDTALSDNIGFRYQGCKDFGPVARAFLDEIKDRFAHRFQHEEDRVLSVILDGENAWGAYCEDARQFFHALYALLEHDSALETVTMREYLGGNAQRDIAPHPLESQPHVHDLFTGSWIDEMGSAPGVDLGTWIGEEEENHAWQLLLDTREALEHSRATPETHPYAFEALYRAEGSDWFWWFGTDQDSGHDADFDVLFRAHLKAVYLALGQVAPATLDERIVPAAVTWTFTQPVATLRRGDLLFVETQCPGVLVWWREGEAVREVPLTPVGGVMAGTRRYQHALGPLERGNLFFRFRCGEAACSGQDGCCQGETQTVAIG